MNCAATIQQCSPATRCRPQGRGRQGGGILEIAKTIFARRVSLRIVYREEVQCAFSVDTARTVHTVVTVDEPTLCGDDQPGAYRFDGDVTSEQAMPKMESRERSVSASSRKPCQAAATAP